MVSFTNSNLTLTDGGTTGILGGRSGRFHCISYSEVDFLSCVFTQSGLLKFVRHLRISY